MSPNRRIFLNIIATYGRSVFALVCGLFSGRWALQALGEVDFGLYGVVGGLTVFISFFNSVLAYSIGRFYALSVGAALKKGNEVDGLEECRRWFSIAVVIHTVVPALLLLVGYPIGEWAVRCFLSIPVDRVSSCVWVFRFVCISCFLGMVSVPFNAMYTAKQYIAELTVYSFATTLLNFCFLYYMVTHPDFWLTKYAFWHCLVVVLPQLIISVRACFIFKECRFRWHYAFDRSRFGSLFKYTGWQMFGTLGSLARGQGTAVLVNKYFGPSVNAAMSIGNTVNGQANSLSGAMQGAFMPAITTAYGSGDMAQTRNLMYRACKFGVLLSCIFTLPLCIEINEVLRLWLVTPPKYTAGLCVSMMVALIIDKSTIGHMVVVHATGRIAKYQLLLGGALISTLPLAWIFFHLNFGVYSLCVAIIITIAVCAWGRVFFTRAYAGVPIREWLGKVFVPLMLTTAVTLAIGFVPSCFVTSGFRRVCMTTLVCEVALFPCAWYLVLDRTEREYVRAKYNGFVAKIRGVRHA